MCEQDRPQDNERLNKILEAAMSYRRSLSRLYSDLDILQSYVGRPEYLIARLVVAELVGGLALPVSDCPCVGVLGPAGERFLVFITDVRDGFRHFQYRSRGLEPDDVLALVVFDRGMPVAVHLVPADRIDMEAPSFSFGLRESLGLSLFSHCDYMLEPLSAAVSGVRSFVLRDTGEGFTSVNCL